MAVRVAALFLLFTLAHAQQNQQQQNFNAQRFNRPVGGNRQLPGGRTIQRPSGNSGGLANTLKTGTSIDLREAVHQSFVRQQKIELREHIQNANPECKKIVSRNAAFLAKGCLPSINIAIKQAPLKEDTFDTLLGIFNRVMDASSNSQCTSKFAQYDQQLRRANCNELAEKLAKQMRKYQTARMIQRFQRIFEDDDDAFGVFDEMRAPNCAPNLENFATYTTQNLNQVCPKTTRAISEWLNISKSTN